MINITGYPIAFKRNVFVILMLTVILTFMFSCKSSNKSDNNKNLKVSVYDATNGNFSKKYSTSVLHPLISNIPKIKESSVIDTSNLENYENDTVNKLSNVVESIRKNENIDTTNTRLLVGRSIDVEVSSIDNRLLVLDKKGYRLIQYNVDTGSKTVISTNGSGPGNVSWAKDLEIDNEKAYVSTGGMRIVTFDCSESPCSYDATTRLRFTPLSLAKTENSLNAVGHVPLSPKRRKIDSLGSAPIQVIDSTGTIQSAYGHSYQSDAWFLNDKFRKGYLEASDQRQETALAYKFLPTIYTYRSHNHHKTFSIPEFSTAVFEYEPEDIWISTSKRDYYDIITRVNYIGNSHYVVNHRKLLDIKDTYHTKYFYYLINTNDNSTKKIGSYKYEGTHSFEVIPLKNNLVIVKKGNIYKL